MSISSPRAEDNNNLQYLHCIDVYDNADEYDGVAHDDKDDDEAREELNMTGSSILELLIDVITHLLKVDLLGLGNRTISSDSTSAATTGRNSFNISSTGRSFFTVCKKLKNRSVRFKQHKR